MGRFAEMPPAPRAIPEGPQLHSQRPPFLLLTRLWMPTRVPLVTPKQSTAKGPPAPGPAAPSRGGLRHRHPRLQEPPVRAP